MIRTRHDHLHALKTQTFDLLVIGGGITGVGVALDATARGLRVALIEKGDIASGTSSWSTKLVHGGVRYLEQYDFPMVREGLRERHTLIHIAPYLVRRLSFLYPVKGGPLGKAFVDSGLWLYDLLAGRRALGLHHRVGRAEEAREAPLKAPWDGGGFSYYDSQTDDARLALAVMLTAVERGAVAATYTEVTDLIKEDGRVVGVHVRDTLAARTRNTGPAGAADVGGAAGPVFLVRARTVVNATGVWMGHIQRMDADGGIKAQVVPSKGAHIVVPFDRLPIKTAVIMPETSDGRVLFAVPWQGRVVVGTTDQEYRGDFDRPTATDAEVDFILANANDYLETALTRDDIIATYAGLRPLIRIQDTTVSGGQDPGGRNQPGGEPSTGTKDLSRNHVVLSSPSGLVSIGGGKLTTYRLMAHDAVEAALKATGLEAPRRADTSTLRLTGTPGYHELSRHARALGAHYGTTPAVARHLLDRYGAHALAVLELIAARPALAAPVVPSLGYVMAEAVYSARHELVTTLEDILARRMRLNLLDEEHGTGVAHRIAELVAPELGWDEARIVAEVARYRDYAHMAEGGGYRRDGRDGRDGRDAAARETVAVAR